jgi:hypothetical protein
MMQSITVAVTIVIAFSTQSEGKKLATLLSLLLPHPCLQSVC